MEIQSDSVPPSFPLPGEASIAGFWQRFLGVFVDSLVLGAFGCLLGFFFFEAFVQIGAWGRLIGFCIALIYFGFMNSRVFGGQTIGKRVARTKVVRGEGTRLTLSRSTIRYLVLGAPFFLNGARIPQQVIIAWYGTLFSILVFGFGASIIYLIVFNRRTRQSLHDLIVGSFVVKRDSAKIIAKVWKGHYVVVAIFLIASAILPRLLSPLAKNEFFKPLLTLQQQIQKEPEVGYVAVNEGVNMFKPYGGETSRTSSLNVTVILRKKLKDYNALANKVAEVVLQNHVRAREKDAISIIIVYGYDIGISSFWFTTPFSFSPAEWEKRIGENANQT